MQGNTRILSEKLHQSLNDMGAAENIHERTQILSKLLNIPKHLAASLLQGHLHPDQELLQKICSEFEFDFEMVC